MMDSVLRTRKDTVRWMWLAIWLTLAFGAAALGGLFPPGDWYAGLQKPAWNPPNWIFGPVWTLLYAAMAVAAWLVWQRHETIGRVRALRWYLFQLAVNAIWSPVFFGWQRLDVAFGVIVLLWISIVMTMMAFYRINRLAGWLFMPYLGWVSFAAVLNYTLWQLNP